MTETHASAAAPRFEVRPTSDSHFSWLRTRLSIERTLMAWVRTAVSLIGFGFTIVQFFDRLGSMGNAAPPVFPDAPRYLGLALIFCGVLSLIVSIWQYNWTNKYIRSGAFAAVAGVEDGGPGPTPLLAVSVALAIIGVFAFFAVAFRLV